MDRRNPIVWVVSVLALALSMTGCGSSSSSTTAASKPAPTGLTTATTTTAPVRRIRILAPRSGAHTGQTVTVRVEVTGSPRIASDLVSLRLDGGRVKRGSARFILRGLAPGFHHLVLLLDNDHAVRATRSFVVRTPAPAPPPAPVQTTPPTTQTQAPSPAPPPPAPAPGPAPTPAPTTNSPPPTTPSGGIPQGNGGDMDSDNNGGPTDGDGNI
jgi:hypothetical protein